MIISLILTLFMLAVLAVGLLIRRRSRLLSLGVMATAVLGTWFAWFPDELTAIARSLGVGRGTDLMLYLWLPVSILVFVAVSLQLRHLQRQITLLVRELALERARAPLDAPPPPAGGSQP